MHDPGRDRRSGPPATLASVGTTKVNGVTIAVEDLTGIEGLRAQLGSIAQWPRPPILPPSNHDPLGAWTVSVLGAANYWWSALPAF